MQDFPQHIKCLALCSAKGSVGEARGILLEYISMLSPCFAAERHFAFKKWHLTGGSTFRSRSVSFCLSVFLPVLSPSLCSLPNNIIIISDSCGTGELHLLIRSGSADASSPQVRGCACNACLNPAVGG